MIAGRETRHSGGIVILGSCLRLTGFLVMLAACLAKLFNVQSFIRPELLEGYPPRGDLFAEWLLVAALLGAAGFLLGRHLCRKRKTLTCNGCDRVISGGSETSLLFRLLPVVLGLAALGWGGYRMANLVLHLDLPRYEEQSSADWHMRLAGEFDAWVATQPEDCRDQEGWQQGYTGPVAEQLLAGGAAARPVLSHMAKHGGTEAAGILLLRLNPKD